MRDRNEILDMAFNKAKLGEKYYRAYKSVSAFARKRIKQSAIYDIFNFVIIYLYKLNRDPEFADGGKPFTPSEITEEIRRFGVLVAYDYYNSAFEGKKKGQDVPKHKYQCDALDNVYETGKYPKRITDKNNKENPFVHYYNSRAALKDASEVYDALHKDPVLQGVKPKFYDNIYAILRNGFRFFTENTNLSLFQSKENLKRYDMLVAEGIEEAKNHKFTFTVDEDFKKNVTDEKKMYVAIVYMGYYLKNCIETNTLVKVPYPYCQLMDTEGDLKFLTFYGDKDSFDMSKLTPFTFTYNDTRYSFDGTVVQKLN